MSLETTVPAQELSRPDPKWRGEWLLALGGLVAVSTAATLNLGIEGFRTTPGSFSDETGGLALLRLVFTVGGIFAIGAGVSLRPAHAGILSVACLGGLIARFGFHPAWDSGRALAGFGSIVAGAAAILMLLPQDWRRVGVSVIVLFHFGGILTAVTSPPTGDNPAPWITQAAYAYVYRPYLQFLYLTSSYQFTEPGPGCELWFCIHYKNGTAKAGDGSYGDSRWFKLPRRPEDTFEPSGLTLHRRAALAHQLDSYAAVPAMPENVVRRRDLRSYGENGILWHPEIPREHQYRPPTEAVRTLLLPSYVRHVAKLRECGHDDGVTQIYSIKVYRVEHRILTPQNMKVVNFDDPVMYFPFFQGEFDLEGNQINADDPMLYWLVPIIYVPKSPNVPQWHHPKTNPEDFVLKDGVMIHAGSDHAFR